MTENKFRWWTGCQGTLSKIYARTEKLLLGPETEVTSNYNPNKKYFTQISWCCGSKICSGYSNTCLQEKPIKEGFKNTSNMSDWIWSQLYPWRNST